MQLKSKNDSTSKLAVYKEGNDNLNINEIFEDIDVYESDDKINLNHFEI